MNLAREAIELLGQVARILWFEGTKHGMRDREWMALRFLSRANRFSRTPSALASYVGTTRGTASFIIGELERLGYLERKRSTKDKRSVTLSVTQQGKKFLARDPVNGLVEAIAVLDDDSKIRFRDTCDTCSIRRTPPNSGTTPTSASDASSSGRIAPLPRTRRRSNSPAGCFARRSPKPRSTCYAPASSITANRTVRRSFAR